MKSDAFEAEFAHACQGQEDPYYAALLRLIFEVEDVAIATRCRRRFHNGTKASH